MVFDMQVPAPVLTVVTWERSVWTPSMQVSGKGQNNDTIDPEL